MVFRYTDNKTGKARTVTVGALEFIRRFLQHVLPHNFMKVRYYGFLAAASRKKLTKLRKMLYLDAIPKGGPETVQASAKVFLCPVCGSQMQWVEKLPKGMPRALPKGFIGHVP